ncbi:hypothetical protein JCM25156A_23940 [Komagataeibacter kakiaceti JCM 25156]|uniref:hypothetical protein n=1 Tax=Komagataeibacter TaxID=1434011 RepID=UPI00046FF9C7|nr:MULTISPECIES: hypothetical protein [Komagataeibacter]MCE2566199.1 hypothetical protein [Komagataeibacter sp. FNDCF1]
MSKRPFKVVYKNTGTIERPERTLEIGSIAIVHGRNDPYIAGAALEKDGTITIGGEEFSFLAQLALFALQAPGKDAAAPHEVNSWLEGYRAAASRVRTMRYANSSSGSETK